MTISLAAIEAADKAATEGPWAIWTDLLDDGFVVVGDKESFDEVMRTGYTEECNPTAKVYTTDDAELIALYRNECPKLAAALRAVISVCQNTDGDWLDPSAEIPVGEVLRMLAEAGIDLDGVHP